MYFDYNCSVEEAIEWAKEVISMKEAQITMKQAVEELRIAENLFNNATTDKEIDYAVYKLNTARAKIDLLSRGEVS